MSTTSARARRALWVAAAAFLLAACTGPSADTGPEEPAPDTGGVDSTAPLDFAVITHGSEGDAFWSVVQNGAQDAGRDLGVKVSYLADGDAGAQSKLIDNAVAQGKTGLVVSMANPDALKSSIDAAVRAGIPVITINSGADRSTEFGAIAHVGQDETVAGKAAGERMKSEGKTKILCVIHEAGNSGLNDRCAGAKEGFGGNVTNLQVDIANPTDTEARIRGALQTDSSVDGVLTLNSQVADRAVAAADSAGSSAEVATFDLNTDVVKSIKEGRILFAVDQQQYQQGYLPVVMLKLYRENGNTLGGGQPVFTGPGFVDESNADQVETYTERGTR